MRVPVALLEMLLDELVVRPRVPPSEGQVPVGREGPAVRFEPKGFRRLDARFLQGLDCFRLGRVDLHLRLRDRFLDSLRLQQGLLAAVVRGLRVRGHVLLIVEGDRVEIPDGQGDRVRLAVERLDLRVFRRRPTFPDRAE